VSRADPLLRVTDLHTRFRTDEGVVRAVDGVSFTVRAGETVCLVGESGSGKTVASESITRLISTPPGEIEADSIYFKGRDLATLPTAQLRGVRGGEIAHVFQNPQGSLNPVYSVGWQLVEAIQLHSDASRSAARERAIELLDRVGIPEATARFDDYPHEFSGGMKQRVVIAMALAGEPDLLIADEPTTALDVTIQAQILRLLADLQAEFGMAVLLITHDLGVVAQVADRVVVLYAGKVMERGSVYDVFESPAHPYTRALLDCLPGRGKRSQPIGGSLPDPIEPPPGCRFAPRCPYAVDACRAGDQPAEYDVPAGPGAADGEGGADHYRGGGSVDAGQSGNGSAGAGRSLPGGEVDHVASCVHYGPGGDPSVVVDGGRAREESDGPTGDGPGGPAGDGRADR
jgi:peptide/nickel transport system ATP-binding protein